MGWEDAQAQLVDIYETPDPPRFPLSPRYADTVDLSKALELLVTKGQGYGVLVSNTVLRELRASRSWVTSRYVVGELRKKERYLVSSASQSKTGFDVFKYRLATFGARVLSLQPSVGEARIDLD